MQFKPQRRHGGELRDLRSKGVRNESVTTDRWCREALAGRGVIMPGPYPREFREDVVAVARSRESGVTIKQIATDFGISEATLQNWLRQADVEEGNRPGQTAADAAEARELKKRIRLLEQENEVLRRAAAYLSQANLKLGGSPK